MSAEYLPSALNVHVQNGKDNSEWKLDFSDFQEIETHVGHQLWICFHLDSATNFLDTLNGNQTQAA